MPEVQTGRSGNAVNKDRKNLIAAWIWGVKFLSLPEIWPFKRVDRLPGAPSLEEFLKMPQAAQGQGRIMLLACFDTAVRRSELLRLK